MKDANKSSLIAAALAVSRHAVAPYSKFSVGAALLTRAGKVYTGANVESVSFGLTCCAERVALFKALSEGERHFTVLAVVAPLAGGPMPCGACRQLLAEFAPGAVVLSADSRKPSKSRQFTVRSLLPQPFLRISALVALAILSHSKYMYV